MSRIGSFLRRHTILRRSLWGLLAVLILLLLVHAGSSARARAERDAVLIAIAEAGLPTTVEEIIPAPVDPEQNAAPHFTAAGELIGVPPEDLDLAWNGDLEQLDGEGWVLLERYRSEHPIEPVLAHIEAAAAKPRCVFPVDYSAGPHALLPQINTLRMVIRRLHLEARVMIAGGEIERSTACIEAAFTTCGALREEPFLISQIVLMSLHSSALDGLQSLCAGEPPSASGLARLQQTLLAAPLPDYVHGLDGERLLFASWIFGNLDHSQTAALFSTSVGIDRSTWIIMSIYSSWLGTPIRLHDQASLYRDLAGMRIALERGADAARAADLPPPRQPLERDLTTPLRMLLLPALDRIAQLRQRLHARRSLALHALAILQHQARTGAYPAALDELAIELPKANDDLRLDYRFGEDGVVLSLPLDAPGYDAKADWTSWTLGAKRTAGASEPVPVD